MSDLATALADVLAADRNLCKCEINAKYIRSRCSDSTWKYSAPLARALSDERDAKATLEAMSEELIAAWDARMNDTIRRAVASMPGQTTEQERT